MNTSVATATDVRRARLAFVLVGLVAPLVIAVVATVLILLWLPDLPDRIVTHWGANGPDGFGSPDMYVWMQVLVGAGIPLLMTLPVLAMMHDSWGITCRFLGAMSLGLSVLIGVGMAGSVATQRGGAEGSGIGMVIALGICGMLVLGVVGWFLQPRVIASSSADTGEATQMRLAPGERAAWFGTAAMSRVGVIVLVIAVLLLVGTTTWVMLLGSLAWWICALATVLVIALIAMTLVFRVRVNASGLRVRSIVGWPQWKIPASEITEVKVVHVIPMGDFGGWGLRIAVDGRMGVVLRTGEALQVTRTTGRVFVVTLDDARTAASVLLTATKGSNS